jgi:hypothetical protein
MKPPGLFSAPSNGNEHTAERRALLMAWAKDPWAFLTGVDIDGKPLIVTQDESNAGQPFRPFPTDKPYLRLLADELLGPAKVVLVDKSRQMMVSTLCMLLLYWTVLFRPGQKVFISKQTEDLAIMLINDKVRGVHRRTPAWFQGALPLSMKPAEKAMAARTGSEIIGVAQNAAVRHFRGNTASIVLVDEAAFQEECEEIFRAAEPMASKIWLVSTANYGNPGAAFFYRLKSEVKV